MFSRYTSQEDPGRLLDQACAELRRRLTAGESCRAEDFLTVLPHLAADARQAVRLICTEWRTRKDLGQQPDLAEFLARFPPWRDDLELQLRQEVGGDSSLPQDPLTVMQAPPPEPDANAVTLHHGGPARPLARHEVFEEIGHGAMGVVYRARDTVLNRFVALKTVHPGVLAGAQEIERFYREARATAQVRHRHVVPIYDVGLHQGRPCFTMALATGGSLADRRRSFADPRAAATLIEKAARAVAAAHALGIIHRDLKPANILFDDANEPLVTDFGLAKFLDGASALTQNGQLIGTPGYMAPEQAAGQAGQVTAATDVWALGVILYELLTGQRPFDGEQVTVTTYRIQNADPVPPRQLRDVVDRDLETIVLKCLEKEPRDRFASATALADELGRWLRGEPLHVRPRRWPARLWRRARRHAPRLLMAGLAVVAAAALGAVFSAQKPEPAPDPDRPLKEIVAQLDCKQPVELIGPTGPPRWSRWVNGAGGLARSPDGKDYFTVQTLRTDYLELVPDPRALCYRFRAEVRHVDGRGLCYAGLYVLHHRYDTAEGPEDFTCDLCFNDEQELFSDVNFQLHRQRHSPGAKVLGSATFQRNLTQTFLSPARRFYREAPWRRLEVRVTSRYVRVYWEGEQVDRLPKTQLDDRVKRLFRPDRPREPTPPRVGPRGGLGLYLHACGASFRNVVLEPWQDDP
jgi:serine/threonine-protein kinase